MIIPLEILGCLLLALKHIIRPDVLDLSNPRYVREPREHDYDPNIRRVPHRVVAGTHLEPRDAPVNPFADRMKPLHREFGRRAGDQNQRLISAREVAGDRYILIDRSLCKRDYPCGSLVRALDQILQRPPPAEEVRQPRRQTLRGVTDRDKPPLLQGVEDLPRVQDDLGDLNPALVELPGTQEKTYLAGNPFIEHVVVRSRVWCRERLAPPAGTASALRSLAGQNLPRPGLVIKEDDPVNQFLEHLKVISGFGRDPFTLPEAGQDGKSKDRLHIGYPEFLDYERRNIDDAAPQPAADQDRVDLDRIHALKAGHHLIDIYNICCTRMIGYVDARKEDPGIVREVAELEQGVGINIDNHRVHAMDSTPPVVVIEFVHHPRPGAAKPDCQNAHTDYTPYLAPSMYSRRDSAAKEAWNLSRTIDDYMAGRRYIFPCGI